jgi:hypothetical protein
MVERRDAIDFRKGLTLLSFIFNEQEPNRAVSVLLGRSSVMNLSASQVQDLLQWLYEHRRELATLTRQETADAIPGWATPGAELPESLMPGQRVVDADQ